MIGVKKRKLCWKGFPTCKLAVEQIRETWPWGEPQGPPVSGGYSEGETPVPIPNTEVKSFSADGTARVTLWESRSSPD